MSKPVPSWLASSAEDPDLTRQQHLLDLVLLGLAGPGFLFGLVMAVMWALGRVPVTGAVAGLGVQPFYLLAYWLSRRGRVRLAAYVPAIVLFVVMAGANYQLGVGHAILIGYAMVTLTAGILIGTRAALLFALLSMGTHLVIGTVQVAGRLPNPMSPATVTTVIADGIAAGLGLTVLVIFNWLSNRELSSMLSRERELSTALRDHQAKLERRVAERTAELARANEQLQNEITERKRAEYEIEERRRYLEGVLAAAPDAIVTLDAEHRVVEWNPGAERLFGYSTEETVGRDLDHLITNPGVLEEAAGFTQTVLSKKRVGPVETVRYRKDDSPVNVILGGSPILFGDELIGIVAVYTDITERKQAEKALHQRTSQLEALREMGLELTAQLDLDTLLRSVVSRSIELLGGSGGGLYLYRPDRDVLEWAVTVDADVALIGTILHRGEGLSGKVWETGEPLIVDDYHRWEGRVAAWEDYPGTGSVGVPIRWGEQFLGVLNIRADPPRAFSLADAELLSLFATQAAIAIRNARLYEEAQQWALEQETLRGAALALTTTLDRDEVINRILAQLQEVVPYDTASVQLLRVSLEQGRKGDRLEIVGGRGFPNLEELLGIAFDPNREDNPNREVIRTQAPVIVADAPAMYDEFSREPHAAAGIRSWLGVPMLVGERLIGMIALDKCEPGFYTQEHARMAEAFAAQAAIAVENSRLFQAEREQRELAEALGETAAAVSSTLDLDQVLDHILERVERVVPGDVFNVMLVQNHTTWVVRQRGHDGLGSAQSSNSAVRIADYPTLQTMMETGEPMVIPDTASDPAWVIVDDQGWLRAYLGAPIRAGGATVGFLNVNGTHPGQFGPADAKRLQAFANHAAAAIENARLYQQLRDHAEQLEQRVDERTAELQVQYARLDAILSSTGDGIIVADAAGNVIQTNPVAHAWLTQTLSPEDAARLWDAVRSVATRTEEQPVALLELRGLDLELSGAPVSEPEKVDLQPVQGEPKAVVAVHDVSHLRALGRMKTRFVTNISHELRTPITTIKLYAYLMQQQPEKWQQYLGALAQEADLQARLVEDILQISRIDAGRLEMEPRPTALNELTEAAVANHQALAWEQGLTLEHRPSPAPSPLRGEGWGEGPVAVVDPERMMQVLNNLVGNAIRYTPEGGTVVVSSGKEKAEGRTWAVVTVSDTGMGIPQEDLPHIFERFFRGEEPRRMQLTGTGLGLSIVEEIVELHGGRVTVASEENVGSTFTVWLPLAEGQT